MGSEAWRKKFKACTVCDKKAVGCYSPDMDVHGLCFCKKHEEQVMIAYMELMAGADDKKVTNLLQLKPETGIPLSQRSGVSRKPKQTKQERSKAHLKSKENKWRSLTYMQVSVVTVFA